VDVRWMSGGCQVDAGWMPGGCFVDARYKLRFLIDTRGDLWYMNAAVNEMFNRCGCQLAYLTNAGGKCRVKCLEACRVRLRSLKRGQGA
jgi:hypothetical protein